MQDAIIVKNASSRALLRFGCFFVGIFVDKETKK